MDAMFSKAKYLFYFFCSYRFKFFKIAYNMKAHGKFIHILVLFKDGLENLNKIVFLFCPS